MTVELAGDSRRRELIGRALKHKPDASSILEVGCGNGVLLTASSTLYPRAALTGIDIVASKIESARRRAPHIRWHTAPVERLPFSDQSFDLILAGMTLHHWKGKQKGLNEVARVLTADGIIVIVDPIVAGPLTRGWVNRLAERLDGGTFTRPEELERMVSRAGLKIIEQDFVPQSLKTVSVYVLGK